MNFIAEYKNIYPIKIICNVLKFPRSTYYKVINRKPSLRARYAAMLNGAIKEIFTCNRNRYGAPKIQKVLATQGTNVSIKCVQRHMSKMGLKSIVIRKWNTTLPTIKLKKKKTLSSRTFQQKTSMKNGVRI